MDRVLGSGKLIVLYGINNLGKSTQAKLLVEKLQEEGYASEYLKYPVYDIVPSGPFLNSYLRESNPWSLSPREAQIIYALNRAQYEPVLLEKLRAGTIVVAEDYWGTGVAWGVGAGVPLDFMLELNSFVYREDIAVLFEGTRFSSGFEQEHLHETNNELMNKVDEVLHDLGKTHDWRLVNANGSIEEVQNSVWEIVKTIL